MFFARPWHVTLAMAQVLTGSGHRDIKQAIQPCCVQCADQQTSLPTQGAMAIDDGHRHPRRTSWRQDTVGTSTFPRNVQLRPG
jgi:hypothetical protein